MIEVKNVTKRFPSVVAIDGLSVVFQPGITGLVGQNGAGKSTLFRTIAGIYLPQEGEILIDGHPAETKEAKAKVFFLPDDPFAPRAPIQGVLDFYRGLFDVDAERFTRLVRTFGLPTDRSVSTFSKGMRRQVFIALSLAMNVDYLLLDEAFDGLDPLVIENIKDEIVQSAEAGKTIVISSHNIHALQKIVDRFVILSKGQLANEGETGDIGTEFVKFQAAFGQSVEREDIENLGFDVVSFRKVGSVTHFVILGDKGALDAIRDAFNTLFIENVALEPDEIVMLEMALARREGGNEDA